MNKRGDEFFLTRSRERLQDSTSRGTENFTALFISEVSYALSDRPSRKVGRRPGKSLVTEQGNVLKGIGGNRTNSGSCAILGC